MDKLLCLSCKGKNPSLCGRTFCPIYTQSEANFKVVDKIDKDFKGVSPPTVFVGSKLAYPNVNVGILSPVGKEEAWKYDDPNYWYKNKLGVKDIVNYRSGLLNSRFGAKVTDIRKGGKLLDVAQEVGMALRPSSIDFSLKKKPELTMSFSQVSLPMGPKAGLEKAKLEENVRVAKPVEKVFSDTDLKAVGGMKYLDSKGYDEHQLSQLLSIGTMGVGKNRVLVSTRSSITAVDDFLGKDMLKEIRRFNQLEDHRMFFGNYLGNYFLCLFFPGVWSFELFEMYLPKTLWNQGEDVGVTTDWEGFKGRTNYADNCTGGYYAARLGVLEKLKKLGKQGSVVLLRFITDEYEAPLGVFVVRQAVRSSLSEKYIGFGERKLMLDAGREFVLRKFGYDINKVLVKSKVLEIVKSQSRLNEWF